MIPDSKVHVANTGPTWALSAPDGPQVGPINLAIRDVCYLELGSMVIPLLAIEGGTHAMHIRFHVKTISLPKSQMYCPNPVVYINILQDPYGMISDI